MTPHNHFEFVVRTLLQIVLFFLLQLPTSYQVQVDRDQFLSAFSMVENGRRTSVADWPLGPGWSSSHQSKDSYAPPSPRSTAHNSGIMDNQNINDSTLGYSDKQPQTFPYKNAALHLSWLRWLSPIDALRKAIPSVFLAVSQIGTTMSAHVQGRLIQSK